MTSPTDSILTGTKKILGITEDYTAFDLDIITHINSVLTILTQLGVGPAQGFSISDETAVWADFIGEDNPLLNSVRTYVFLRVRILFDPPTTRYLYDALNDQVNELSWRLNIASEPAPPTEAILDGGTI